MRRMRIGKRVIVLIGLAALTGCTGYTTRKTKTGTIDPNAVATTPTPDPTDSSTPTPTPTPTVTVQPLLQRVVHAEIRRNGTNMGPFFVNCPAGYVLTGGGTRLKTYVAGAVKPDSSYPHLTQNSWVVVIGGPQTGHKDNVWEAYAVCLKDPEFPGLHRQVVREIVQGNSNVIHVCPILDKTLTDAGTELTNWVGGQNNPQAVFINQNGYLETRAGNGNTWYVNYICLERRDYVFSTVSEELNAQNPSIPVQCSGGKVLVGGAGGTELTSYNGGEVSLKRALPGLWAMEYEIPNATTQNTWKAYARCVRKP